MTATIMSICSRPVILVMRIYPIRWIWNDDSVIAMTRRSSIYGSGVMGVVLGVRFRQFVDHLWYQTALCVRISEFDDFMIMCHVCFSTLCSHCNKDDWASWLKSSTIHTSIMVAACLLMAIGSNSVTKVIWFLIGDEIMHWQSPMCSFALETVLENPPPHQIQKPKT